MSRSYGDKYAAMGGRYMPAAEIAKLMRADIKDAIASGELPGSAKNYSVKIENYSGGRSIRIKAVDLDGMWEQCKGVYESENGGIYACNDPWCKAGGLHADSEHAKYHDRLSAEGSRVQKILRGIWDGYNHDGSDVMTDYFDRNYYGEASIESAWDRRFRLAEKARAEARKARKEVKV